LPLNVEISAGQCHDSTQFEAVLEATPLHLGRPRKRPRRVAGDKGYSYPRVRQWLKDFGTEALIPMREDQLAQCKGKPPTFDKRAYRRRSIIEQCIGWLKECRRIGTRFEKLAINFLAMLKLGMIQRYLKLAFSDRA
jgi:transposase